MQGKVTQCISAVEKKVQCWRSGQSVCSFEWLCTWGWTFGWAEHYSQPFWFVSPCWGCTHAPHAAHDPSEYSPTPRSGCPSACRTHTESQGNPVQQNKVEKHNCSELCRQQPTTFWLTSVLGGDKQNWIRPILAFSTRLTLLLATLWVRTRPSTSSQSSMVPLKTRSDNKSTKHKKREAAIWLYSPKLLDNFNIVEVDTGGGGRVNNPHDCIHTHWCQQTGILRHHFGAQRCGGAVEQRFTVTQLYWLAHGRQHLHAFIHCLLKGLGDDGRVDACSTQQSKHFQLVHLLSLLNCNCTKYCIHKTLVCTSLQQSVARIQQCSSNHHHRGCSISSFDVLGFGQLNKLTAQMWQKLNISQSWNNKCNSRKSPVERTILAEGWSTCICLRMVAPSLVMVTSPFSSWI